MSRRFTEDQMREGRDAYDEGELDVEDCPHADGDPRLMWRAGWITGLLDCGMSFMGNERRDDAIVALHDDHSIRAEDFAAWDLDELDSAMQDRGYIWIEEFREWVLPVADDEEVQP